MLRATGPNYWFAFFLRNGTQGWNYLGGVVLCITGAWPASLLFNVPCACQTSCCLVKVPCTVPTCDFAYSAAFN